VDDYPVPVEAVSITALFFDTDCAEAFVSLSVSQSLRWFLKNVRDGLGL